jgi:hypothetical protein
MGFYQGFDIRPVRRIPDAALFSSRTERWVGEGLRGVRLEARTLRELKKKIADYHTERRSK